MKNLLLGFLFFLSISISSKAQYFTPIHNAQAIDYIGMVKYFGIPYGSTPALNSTRQVPGALFFRTTDSSLYLWSGTQWLKNGNGSGSGNTYIDSLINIYNYYTNIQSSRNKLISGALVHDTLLTFKSTALVYQINDSIYTAAADSITLPDADVSNNKYVAVYVDINGDLGYIVGPTPPPSIPAVNEDAQLLLGTYEIKAGALVPTDITNYDIYKEVTDGWAILNRGTISTGYDSAATMPTVPFAGSYSLLIPAVVNGQYFEFEDGADYNIADMGYLTWYLRLRGTFAATTRLTVSLWYNNSQVSVGGVQLVTGAFGYDRTVINQYQLNAIPAAAFSMLAGSGGVFNKIRITLSGTNANGFQLDNIKLQAGGVNTGTITGVTTFNSRDGNVMPLKADYGRFFIDSAGYDADTTHYRYYASGTYLFQLETFRTFTVPGYLMDFDSLDNRTTKVGVDSAALAALLAGSGSSIDTAYVAMGLATDSSYVLMYHSDRAITPDTLRAFGVVTMDTTWQTLTDGATITFNAANGRSARVTLGGNRTLAFTNFSNGMFLSLAVIQDGTGSRTLTLPASTRVIAGGAGAVTLTTAASSHDILTFWKINNILYCNYGKNYN